MSQSIDLNSNQTGVINQTQDLIANAVNQYIVRPTGGTPTSGINGFVFDIFAEEEITLESEITDHYVEDNYAIQDHIAQKPVRFVVKGYVAELTDLFPNTLLSILTTVQSLSSVGGFLPAFSAQATQVYAKAAAVGNQIGNVISQAKDIYSILSGSSTSATKQQGAYTTFYNFWVNRQLCTVETPFGVLYNMAIERVTPLQAENTQIISEFTVSFKQIRLATTQTTPLTINNPDGSGAITPANFGLPSNNLTSPSTGLLDTSINNIQSNSKGRLSQMVNPVNIGGQTTGQDADIGTLQTSFGLTNPLSTPLFVN